ncbi:PRD domain-containing protein, partial [Streptococcus pyogenes]
HLTRSVVEKMEEVSLLNFEQRDKLEDGLKRHLIPAFFRLKYRLFSTNSYTSQIKENYPDLFELVQAGLKPLEEEIGY